MKIFRTYLKSFIFAALVSSVIPNVSFAQNSKASLRPANADEMNTYTIMSIATFCEARARGIDFQKSMIVSVAGQAAAFFQKHGALIEGNKTKITDKQFVGMASFSVVGGALKICPKNVPAKEKEKYNAMVKDIEKRSKSK